MRPSFSVRVCLLALLGSGANGNEYDPRYAPDTSTIRLPKSPSISAFQFPNVPSEYLPTYEANRHYDQMKRDTSCRYPRPVVVDAQKYYVNSSIKYLPSCTILHRCDQESGCCERGQSCSAKMKQFVDLYFYTIPADSTKKYSTEVVKLTFTNHTLCTCKKDQTTHSPPPNPVTQTVTKSHGDTSTHDDACTHKNDNNTSDSDFGCLRCPEPFAERILDDGLCSCDCFDKDHTCKAIKKGRKTMAPRDARCVRAHDCGMPTCSTGSFDARMGRCPLYESTKRHHKHRSSHNTEVQVNIE